jgi:uncharacterized Zn finger protein (UPF0148 family)
MSRHQDNLTYDDNFEQGKDFGSITCPKCNMKVLYGQHGITRPKYCSRCEKEEYTKLASSENFSRLSKEHKHKLIMDALRMPMPSITRKTIQELVSSEH